MTKKYEIYAKNWTNGLELHIPVSSHKLTPNEQWHILADTLYAQRLDRDDDWEWVVQPC